MQQDSFQIELIKEGVITIEKDQTILEASLSAGIPHYHACGGNAKCTTCKVLVVEGAENLSVPNEMEKLLTQKLGLPDSMRLACQTKVIGEPVRLNRVVRDATDVGLYKGKKDDQIGEEKVLVLMFLDIRGFTPFVEKHLAFDVIHVVRKLFVLFQQGIDINRGQIIETAGDGLYAVFGMNDTPNNAALSAMIAAKKLIADMEEFNTNYLKIHFNYQLQIGIGVHAGSVIMGNVKIGAYERLAVMGLAVNVASRIQAATKELNNNFLVSEEVISLLPGVPTDISPKFINVKGVSDILKVYPMGTPYQ